MARPIKKGLDYFPLNTDFMNNRTIRRLKRKGGFKAIVLYMDLLCDIYANSYFIEIKIWYFRHQKGRLYDEKAEK